MKKYEVNIIHFCPCLFSFVGIILKDNSKIKMSGEMFDSVYVNYKGGFLAEMFDVQKKIGFFCFDHLADTDPFRCFQCKKKPF